MPSAPRYKVQAVTVLGVRNIQEFLTLEEGLAFW